MNTRFVIRRRRGKGWEYWSDTTVDWGPLIEATRYRCRVYVELAGGGVCARLVPTVRYAHAIPSGGVSGPMPRTEAHALRREIGGRVLKITTWRVEPCPA